MGVWLSAFTALLISQGALAQPVQQAHSRAELMSEQRQIGAGTTLVLGLRLQMDPDWHVYWKNPGDSGMATSIKWSLPEGFSATPVQWPAPQRIDVGPITSYGYSHEVVLLTEVRAPAQLTADSVDVKAQADWLVCKDICIPASANFSLTLPVAAQPVRDAVVAARFDAVRAQHPRAMPAWTVNVTRHTQGIDILLTPPPGVTTALRQLAFVPDREGDIEDSFAQSTQRTAGGYRLRLQADAGNTSLSRLSGVLTAASGFDGAAALLVDAPVQAVSAPPPEQASLGLIVALLLAFAGGLILNLMPCVFPVLTIKVLGVVERAHGSKALLRQHGLLFTLGVLLSFMAIAAALLWLRAQGAELGWGFQLQSPMVVSVLALLFLALGLNLSGVYEMGARAQALAGRVRPASERLDALASGLLAALVATPCTAPFMGAALGFAVTQPPAVALSVFGAIALGMALPYAVLCFFPAWLRWLPKPGRWMETLRQFLAFPLYATVVWLLWVLARQIGIDGAARLMLAMVLLASALWCWGRLHPTGTLRPLASVVLMALAFWVAWPRGEASPAEQAWSAWSEAAVHDALGNGQPVFVDFTAAWCVSCQVNKRLVLHRDAVTRAFDAAGVRRLRADWTHRDPDITRALDALGRNGVPVYALYRPGSAQPTLLPEILTTGMVLDALGRLPMQNPRAASVPSIRRSP